VKIRALEALTIRDAETGELTSIPFNSVADVDAEVGGDLIEDGLAEEYKLVEPTGTKNITDNGETDVTIYATAQVVDADLVAENIKKDVDILGVVGSYEGGNDLALLFKSDCGYLVYLGNRKGEWVDVNGAVTTGEDVNGKTTYTMLNATGANAIFGTVGAAIDPGTLTTVYDDGTESVWSATDENAMSTADGKMTLSRSTDPDTGDDSWEMTTTLIGLPMYALYYVNPGGYYPEPIA